MSATYIIEPIGPRTMDRAYPLARVMSFAQSLEEWREFCISARSPAVRNYRGRVVVASNESGFVKGVCIYSIRDHFLYGRVLDVPILIVASAADPIGVALDFVSFFRSECGRSNCSGVRFWTTRPETSIPSSPGEGFSPAGEGVFLSASASLAEMERAVDAYAIGHLPNDRSSR